MTTTTTSTAAEPASASPPRRLVACCDDPTPIHDVRPDHCDGECEPPCQTCWPYCSVCGADLSDELIAALHHNHDTPVEVDGERFCPGCGLRFCQTLNTIAATRGDPAEPAECDRYATGRGNGRRCTEHQDQFDGENPPQDVDHAYDDDVLPDFDDVDEWPDPEGMAFYVQDAYPNPEYL